MSYRRLQLNAVLNYSLLGVERTGNVKVEADVDVEARTLGEMRVFAPLPYPLTYTDLSPAQVIHLRKQLESYARSAGLVD